MIYLIHFFSPYLFLVKTFYGRESSWLNLPLDRQRDRHWDRWKETEEEKESCEVHVMDTACRRGKGHYGQRPAPKKGRGRGQKQFACLLLDGPCFVYVNGGSASRAEEASDGSI